MIWSILPYKDTTVYEQDKTRNTGLDQINELRLKLEDSNYYESRILMSFDTNKISNYLTENSIDTNDISASLNIRVTQAYELPFNYEIGIRPLAQEWINGTGYITGNRISNGATWQLSNEVTASFWTGSVSLTPIDPGSLIYTQVSGSLYKTGSYDTVINYNTVKGGGSWYIDSGSTGSLYCYQSFDYKTDQNINVDVSSIVKLWLTGSIPNYGFIIYLNKIDTNTSSSILFNSNTMIQTYGTETNTIYSPVLTIYNMPSQSYSPSNAIINPTGSIIVYQKNFNGEVKYNTKHKFTLSVRPQYPRPAFSQNTVYSNSLNLPSSSYYQITDAKTHDVIIPYSQFTVVDTINENSFIEFYTNMLYPERYYNIELKTEIGSETHYISSPEFTFKVVR